MEVSGEIEIFGQNEWLIESHCWMMDTSYGIQTIIDYGVKHFWYDDRSIVNY